MAKLKLMGYVFITCAMVSGQNMNSVGGDELDISGIASPLAKMIADPGVAEELELVEEQVEELQDVLFRYRTFFRKHHGEAFKMLVNDPSNAKFKDSEERGAQTAIEYEHELATILLPHQLERLRQLQVQKAIQLSLDSTFGTIRMAKHLDLTSEQKKEIKTKAKEFDETLLKELQKAVTHIIIQREKHRKEILKELSDEQRKSYDKVVGVEFFQPSSVSNWLTRAAKPLLRHKKKDSSAN